MSLPRAVLPNRFYLLTRRCTQGLMLMRPDAATNNAFLYCLALAASMFGIDVVITCAMSNHHHTVIFDRSGMYPQFIEYFHKLFARSENALRERRENFWSSAQASVVHLVEPLDVIRKIVYTAVNPVRANLVERVVDWPGVNTFAALLDGRELRIPRPKHFFRENGPTPAEVTLRCALPEELGAMGVDLDAFLASIARRVEDEEKQLLERRKREHKAVLGVRKVLAQNWRRAPATEERPRGARIDRSRISPSLAAKNEDARIAALIDRQTFLEEYREARSAWLTGARVKFPAGTYWLRRFAGVRVAPHTPDTPKPARRRARSQGPASARAVAVRSRHP